MGNGDKQIRLPSFPAEVLPRDRAPEPPPQEKSNERSLRSLERKERFSKDIADFLEWETLKLLRRGSERNTKAYLSDKLTQLLRAEGEETAEEAVTPEDVDRLLTRLRLTGAYFPEVVSNGRHMYYRLSTRFPPKKPLVLPRSAFPSGTVPSGESVVGKTRFGAIANTELGNRFYRDDALLSYYLIAARRGVKTVFLCGDILAGPRTKHTLYEIENSSLEWQARNLVLNYPNPKDYPELAGMTTYFITAPDCEGKYIDADKIEVGEFLQHELKSAGRDDLKYIGHGSGVVRIPVGDAQCTVFLGHQTGKVPYAKSYPAQKRVRSYQGGNKPHVLLLGHLMQAEELFEREVWTVQVGGFKQQTPSMQNSNQSSTVAGYIMDVWKPGPGEDLTTDQPFAFWPDRVIFYDRQYYQDLRKMKEGKGR